MLIRITFPRARWVRPYLCFCSIDHLYYYSHPLFPCVRHCSLLLPYRFRHSWFRSLYSCFSGRNQSPWNWCLLPLVRPRQPILDSFMIRLCSSYRLLGLACLDPWNLRLPQIHLDRRWICCLSILVRRVFSKQSCVERKLPRLCHSWCFLW